MHAIERSRDRVLAAAAVLLVVIGFAARVISRLG